MSENQVLMKELQESLSLTSEGEFELEAEGQIRNITQRKAENWFKKRFPRRSWNRMLKEANSWLKDQKKAA